MQYVLYITIYIITHILLDIFLYTYHCMYIIISIIVYVLLYILRIRRQGTASQLRGLGRRVVMAQAPGNVVQGR